MNKAQSWKFLKEQLSKITDRVLRNVMTGEFRKRAIAEWGFDPETGEVSDGLDYLLDDWEKEFINDINDTLTYGIDTREEKRKATEKETRDRIRLMIRNGETLADVPDDVRTPYIEKLFLSEMLNYADELIKCADDLIGEQK